LSEDVLVTREERGNISVLTMVYRPYNLLGPKLMNALVEQVEASQKAGSRAIVIRSGLRHFSAGADLDIFDKRVAAGAADQASENRRLNGVEFLRFMELLPVPLIASVHGVCPAAGSSWRFRATTSSLRLRPRSDRSRRRSGFIPCLAESSGRCSGSVRSAPRKCRCWPGATMR